ncbi:unnamed protein product [Cunninghamella echinulata]
MSEPLLNRHSLQYEEDWLGKETKKKPKYVWTLFFAIGLTLFGMVLGSFLTPFHSNEFTQQDQATQIKQEENTTLPKNVIMMISDGLGPASVSLARSYYQHINGFDYDYLTPLDTIHVGQSRTRSASSLVTDSAAGATAISCGLKTYNRGIGVDPKGNPCGTVLESAKHQHYMKTGLVATSRITHATPASFSAHIKDRDNEDGIAIQQIGDNPLGRSLDLMFGGGYCHFLPKSDKDGCRKDKRHLFNEAKETHNWQTVLYNDRNAWDQLPMNASSVLPVISLFSSGHMAYEIDRDITKEPSLTEMSKKALDLLFDATSDSDKGFFLMIEGSRIDMAGHANDPAAHVHDTLEYEKTVALVKEYVEKHPGTIMISTSDHETGGLSLGRSVGEKYPEYKWNPEVLTKVKNSSEVVADIWRKADKNEIATTDYLKENIISNYLGVNDISKEEIDRFMSAKTKKKSLKILATYFSEVVSRRAMIGWTGRGHSGVDVNLYAMGSTTEALRGSHENTDIGKFIANYLNLDLKNITETLQKKNNNHHRHYPYFYFYKSIYQK